MTASSWLRRYFARWLPSPFIPADLTAAGMSLSEAKEAQDASRDVAEVATEHLADARATFVATSRQMEATAARLTRLAREVAAREAQLEPGPHSASPGDAR